MKIVQKVLFVLFTILICSNQLRAQKSLLDIKDLSQTNINDYSDSQLISLYNKLLESGISENQFSNLFEQKGLPVTEIAKLKDRLRAINYGKNDVQNEIKEEKSINELHPYDSIDIYSNQQKFQNDKTIFGSELFTSNSIVFEPNLHIPAPAGYILGPDDELVISIYGYSEKEYHVTVNQLGEIYIPNVGPINVNGLSIEKASDKIKSKLASTIYKAINSGATKVQITLGKIKSIRVTVIGEAKKPGTFTVSSLTTLYNILYLCGGPTPMGSYRDIQLIRSNEEKRIADLYDFLIKGNKKDNIILQEGDVIRIPYYKNRVTISGNVKREGKFEMLDSETFSDLLNYCGGFMDNAFRGTVTVIRITDTEKKIIDLKFSQYNSFKPNSSDEYIVRKLQDEFGNRIVIEGAVNRPGEYELAEGTTVKDLVEKAGGLKNDAYGKEISIFRYLSNKTPTTLSIDLDSSLQYGQQVNLQKNDSIYVHSIFDFADKNYITIEGNVRQPGIVQWRRNFTLRDLLLSVGGLTASGDSSNIEISRRMHNADIDKANHNESEVFNMNLLNISSPQSDVYLQPYDMVIVKALPGYTQQRSVLILGEVKSPGRYGLEKSGDKISDVMARTGGFKASADSTSITIRRSSKSNLTAEEKEKLFQRILNINADSLAQNSRLKNEIYKKYDLISIDLEAALSHPERPENLALEDGDVLTIERSSNLVSVSGEVYYPTIVPYKANKNLKYYVQQAGNFTSYARKTGALVIHPDGKAASVKHFLFFKSYPSVTPRSEIFVPQKNKSNKSSLSVAELALIVSSLAIIANVIINITK